MKTILKLFVIVVLFVGSIGFVGGSNARANSSSYRVFLPIVVNSPKAPTVINSVWWQDGSGRSEIMGEIRNDNNVPVDEVLMEGIMYDQDGNIVASKQWRARIWVLNPGVVAPFGLDFFSTPPSATNYSVKVLSFDTDITRGVQFPLGIDKPNFYTDPINPHHIYLDLCITNDYDVPKRADWVWVTMYTADGVVSGVGEVYLPNSGGGSTIIPAHGESCWVQLDLTGSWEDGFIDHYLIQIFGEDAP